MQPRARRSTELTGRQVTCTDLPPRSIRRKSLSPATLATRPRQRPCRPPVTPSREYRRRRTPPRQRQGADRPESAEPSIAGPRRAGETSVRKPFDPPDLEAVANDEPCDCSRPTEQCLSLRRRHCFRRILRKQCRRPLRMPLPGFPARRSGAPRPSLRDARALAPGGPQAAPLGPCRVPLRLRGPRLGGRPQRGPVASAGDRSAGQTHAGPSAQRPSAWDVRLLAPNGPQAAPVGPCRVARRPRGPVLEGRPGRGPVASVGRRDVASRSAAASPRHFAASQRLANADAVRRAATGGHQAAHVGPCRVPLRLHGPGVEGPSERRPAASVGEARDREPGPAQQGDADHADRLRNRVFRIKCEVPGLTARTAAT